MLSSQKAFRKNELEDLIKTFKEKLLFPHQAKENNTRKITEELILAFQKLAEVIEHYQDFFDNALQGIFIATIEGKVIACNPECAKMLGHESNEELIGKIRRQAPITAASKIILNNWKLSGTNVIRAALAFGGLM